MFYKVTQVKKLPTSELSYLPNYSVYFVQNTICTFLTLHYTCNCW